MIERVWEGPELEGFKKGEKTLFVEGLYINASEVISFLQKTTCKRLYLGAGGKGIIEVKDIVNLYDYCLLNDIELVAEIPIQLVQTCDIEIFKKCYIILTISGEKSNYVNEFKTDDHKEVVVYKLVEKETTDLSTLNNGLYKEDTLIYEYGGR